MMKIQTEYDVVILGGGLSGLTIALQLKLAKPDISILILEKRTDKAPIAKHNVGESTSELGSYYLREVLQLKEYLNEHQLQKFGLRFFFNPNHRDKIARRVEFGSKIPDPIPAHQMDRGLFENELVRRLITLGVEIKMGSKVKGVVLSDKGHKIHFERSTTNYSVVSRWIIDSTGRRGFLKRKLSLEKEFNHDINAVWFRLACDIDIDDWSENKAWKSYLTPGRRRLSTNHLMGKGYWVWIIPLVSGHTSIGIVADPSFHELDQINTFEKAMNWLEKQESLAARMLGIHKEKLIDFKVIKHLAHDTKQFYSKDRWGITGDAGVFIDPFYSPGIDFIALNNSWLTELIIRDISEEDIALRTMIYGHAHREIIEGWAMLYKGMYGIFDNTQIMLMKIVWDWASYWGILSLMFMNNGYIDIAVLKQYSATSKSIGRRFSKLNEQMQSLFRAWSQQDVKQYSDQHLNVFELEFLYQFHRGLDKKYDPNKLIVKVESNLKILEQISAEIFRLVSTQIHGTSPNLSVDPYSMNINDSKEELLEKSKRPEVLVVVENIKGDLAKLWLSARKIKSYEYVK